MDKEWDGQELSSLVSPTFEELLSQNSELLQEKQLNFPGTRNRSNSISTVFNGLYLDHTNAASDFSTANPAQRLHHTKRDAYTKVGKSAARRMSLVDSTAPAVAAVRRASIAGIRAIDMQSVSGSRLGQVPFLHSSIPGIPQARSYSTTAAFGLAGGDPNAEHPRAFYCNDNEWNHINNIVANVVSGSRELRRRNSVADECTLAKQETKSLHKVDECAAESGADNDLLFEFLDEKLFSEDSSNDDELGSDSTLAGDDQNGDTLHGSSDFSEAATDDRCCNSMGSSSSTVNESSLEFSCTSNDDAKSLPISLENSANLSCADDRVEDPIKKVRPNAPFYDPERPLLCPHKHCGKRFTNKMNLRSHLRIHDNVKNYPCTLCPAEFRRCHDLKRHVRSLHTGVKMYLCDQCNKRFSRADALKRHLEREGTQCYNPLKAQLLHSQDNMKSGFMPGVQPMASTIPAINQLKAMTQKAAFPLYGFPQNAASNRMNGPFGM